MEYRGLDILLLKSEYSSLNSLLCRAATATHTFCWLYITLRILNDDFVD
jgi:hypothetical protein